MLLFFCLSELFVGVACYLVLFVGCVCCCCLLFVLIDLFFCEDKIIVVSWETRKSSQIMAGCLVCSFDFERLDGFSHGVSFPPFAELCCTVQCCAVFIILDLTKYTVPMHVRHAIAFLCVKCQWHACMQTYSLFIICTAETSSSLHNANRDVPTCMVYNRSCDRVLICYTSVPLS